MKTQFNYAVFAYLIRNSENDFLPDLLNFELVKFEKLDDLMNDWIGRTNLRAVILTVRETTEWLDFVRHKILKQRTFFWMNSLDDFLQFGATAARMFDYMMKRSLGYTVDMNNDKECAAAYEKWNQRVQRYVPVERLLVFRVTDGWEPLCQFLQVPVPTIPFPHENNREQFHSHIKFHMDKHRIQILLLLAMSLVCYIVFKRKDIYVRGTLYHCLSDVNATESFDSGAKATHPGYRRWPGMNVDEEFEVSIRALLWRAVVSHRRDHAEKWLRVDKLVSQSPDGHIEGSLFDEIFKGYGYTVDYPACTYYAQLMEHYPHAKVTLTFRETTRWLDSARHTILKQRTFSWMNGLLGFLHFGATTARMLDCLIKRSPGYTVGMNNDKECAAAFEEWNQRVQRYVPAERLLMLRVTNVWEPLCRFRLEQKDSPRVRKPSIVVIGAGLGRTGTLSLKTALEHIYGEPCYHMREILGRHREHAKKWLLVDELVSQSPDGHIDGHLFDEILQGYRCIVDYPGCTYYAQLMEHYPEAKIILTVRETTKWLDSVRHTFLKQRTFSWVNWLDASVQFGAVIARMFDCGMKRSLGYTVDINNDNECAAAYEKWNQRVQRYVPADRLLNRQR
ncbi:hypothetical protein T265_08613 [Opisthorchis viverrini]|uniref:Uncharacterized protein n=1 Tax=Opisthorchis viverrini TaxID=6198 RepID=A0A075A7T5_OPIVI|nr:hypothetical protein T265_08613 [Opisthorchis viverrini]KER23534.1 hypothetical protein T265_08613 [Opisthorchis viverrini]